MDSDEASCLVASVRMFFEMENETAITTFRQVIAQQAEEISMRKLREEQLEKKMQTLKSRHELRQSDLELKVREVERCAEERLKRYKRDTELTLAKYRETIEVLRFRCENILEEIQENKSIQEIKITKDDLKLRFLKNVNLEQLPSNSQWSQEGLKLELERIREERILEKVQLNKYSRKTELFVRLAEEREAQLQEKEQQIAILSGVSEKVYQTAGIYINEFVSTQVKNLRVFLTSMQAFKQKIVSLEEERYNRIEGARKDQVTWQVKESNWEKMQMQYTRQIKQLEDELKTEQMKREICLKENQQFVGCMFQRLDAANRVAEKRAKTSSLVLEGQVKELTRYYQTLLDNWKTTAEKIKQEQGGQDGQSCESEKNNYYAVMKTLEQENTQMRLQNVSLVDQVSRLSLEYEEIKKLNENMNFQMKELFGELEDVKITNIHYKNELERKNQSEMVIKERNIQEQQGKIGCNSRGECNLGRMEGNEVKWQKKCADAIRLDAQDKCSNGGKDAFDFTKSVSRDTSNANLQLESAQEKKHYEQSSSFSKIQADEQEISHRDERAVTISTILKKKRVSEQPTVNADESTYESTVKAVLANLRSELSGLTSLRKTRDADLAGELLEILAKQLLDHGREKSELADQVRDARERFSRSLSIDEIRRAQEYQQSQANLRESLQIMMQRIEESDKYFLNRLEENSMNQREFRSQLQAKFQDKLTQEAIDQAQFTAEMQAQFDALSQLHKQTIAALAFNPPANPQKSSISCASSKHTPEKQQPPAITISANRHPSDEDPTQQQSSSFFLSELLSQKENSYPYSEPSKPPAAASGSSKLQLLQPRILFSQQKTNIQSTNSNNNNTMRKSIASKINRSLKMSSSLLDIADTPIQASSLNNNRNDLDHISTTSQKETCILPQSRYSVNSYHNKTKQRYCMSSCGNNEENHSIITNTTRQQQGQIYAQRKQQQQQQYMSTIDGVICTEEQQRSPNRYKQYLSEGMFTSLSTNHNNDMRSSLSTAVKSSKKSSQRAQSLLNPIVISKNQSDLRLSTGITTAVTPIIPIQPPNHLHHPTTLRRQSHSTNKPISATIATVPERISFPSQLSSFQQPQSSQISNNGRQSMRLSQLALVSAETITNNKNLQPPANIRLSRIMSSS